MNPNQPIGVAIAPVDVQQKMESMIGRPLTMMEYAQVELHMLVQQAFDQVFKEKMEIAQIHSKIHLPRS